MVPGWNYRWTPIAHLGKEASEHEKLAVIGVVLKPDFQHVLCRAPAQKQNTDTISHAPWLRQSLIP